MTSNARIRNRIRPYHDERFTKALCTKYDYLLAQDSQQAVMWLNGLEDVLARCRATDAAFDKRLSAILQDEPVHTNPPIIHTWITTRRRDDKWIRFKLNAPSISASKRGAIPVPVIR